MAWSTPLTAVTNATLTAAQWNASVRDNLNETAVAKATVAGTIFVATGANTIAERLILDHVIDTQETTTATSYANLATNGPTVTVTSGAHALVWINSRITNTGSNSTLSSFGISGATTTAAEDKRAIIWDSTAGANPRTGVCTLIDTNAGSNTFLQQYRVAAGTGTFTWRRLQVMAL